MKLKEYYTNEFPTDELGNEINENATFEGLFAKLAEICGVGYGYIYDQWLLGD